VFTGRGALKAKLVDEIGGEDVAKAWLVKSKGLSDDLDIRTYEPKDPVDRLVSAEALIQGFARLLGAGVDLVSDGVTLDGLVSVWHPDGAK
ncbi:MAG: signal peptide peptidase SppA, partial [Rhodobiaceae bacterium]|nr:signal peptide peptidase SppA [Rhodobiaceae bacterium]